MNILDLKIKQNFLSQHPLPTPNVQTNHKLLREESNTVTCPPKTKQNQKETVSSLFLKI